MMRKAEKDGMIDDAEPLIEDAKAAMKKKRDKKSKKSKK
jgi:hypothetical protein